jgi:hypothetical protein
MASAFWAIASLSCSRIRRVYVPGNIHPGAMTANSPPAQPITIFPRCSASTRTVGLASGGAKVTT